MAKRKKVPKPYPTFPLFWHPSGQWCKKIKGKHRYFGNAPDDWEAALRLYELQAPDLHAGRPARPTSDNVTVADLANRFLTDKQRALDAGEIVPYTFRNYHACCSRIVGFFGRTCPVETLTAEDFAAFRAELAKGRGPASLGLEITQARVVFKYGFDQGLLKSPVRYGQGFNKPSARVLRRDRAQKPAKRFEAADLRTMIETAEPPLDTFIYLGLNCAFGPSDIGKLPLSAIDLRKGWIVFPRPKTGVERRIPLWDETQESIRSALADRAESARPEYDGLAFLTPWGAPWSSSQQKHNLIGSRFRKLARGLGVHQNGVGFYSLRHVFRTISDETRDFPAVNVIMGHTDSTMGATYRERIDDARLEAVVEHVRGWLFGG